MVAINNKTIENAVVGIICDHIIMERVASAIMTANSAFYPKQDDEGFSPYDNYGGFYNAFLVLGISEEEVLRPRLSDKLNEISYNSEESAKILAVKIYKEWLVEIKNYFVEVKNMKPKLVKV